MKFYEHFKEKKSPEQKREIFAGLQKQYGIKKDAVRNYLKFDVEKQIQKLQIIAKNFNTSGSSSIDELVKEINQPNPTPKTLKL